MKEIKYPQLIYNEQYKPNDTEKRIRIVCYWLMAITTFLLVTYLKMKEVC